jgi:FkbM family methyltransferase
MFTRLAQRLSRTMRKGVLAVSREHRWRRVPAGFSMMIDPREFHDRAFYIGVYEPEVTALIREIVSPGDTCIDIGAQKGYFTLQMAKRVGPTGKVHCFEPDPNAQKILAEHLRHNHCVNTVLHPYIVADVDGPRQFGVSDVVGWSSCFPNDLAQKHIAQTISIQGKALDGIKIDTSHLSFIKLDAEGAEPLVIRGMLNTLKCCDACLSMEINPGSLKAAGFSVGDLEEPLIRIGYSFATTECDRNLDLHIKPLENVHRYIKEGRFDYVNVAVMRPHKLAQMTAGQKTLPSPIANRTVIGA